MNQNDVNGKFYMAGTEGTGEYVVIAATPRGRVGYRTLDTSRTRIRVEPASPEWAEKMRLQLNGTTGWKQPDSQFRFSVVTTTKDQRDERIRHALAAIGAGVKGTEINSAAPQEYKDFVPVSLGMLARLRNALKKFMQSAPEQDSSSAGTEGPGQDPSL